MAIIFFGRKCNYFWAVYQAFYRQTAFVIDKKGANAHIVWQITTFFVYLQVVVVCRFWGDWQ